MSPEPDAATDPVEVTEDEADPDRDEDLSGVDDDSDDDSDDGGSGDAEDEDLPLGGAGPDAGAGEDASSGAAIDGATLVVAGVSYEVVGLRRCEEDGAFPMPVELEYQVFAEGPQGSGQLDLFVDGVFDQVSWAGPEGIYGNVEDAVVVGLASDRAASSVTLVDSLTAEGSLAVSYDLPVLGEDDAVACR